MQASESRRAAAVRVLAFLLLLALLLSGLSWVYRPRNNNHRGGMNYVYAHGFLAHGSDELDAVFVGCSEFYAGVSPLMLWEDYGITSDDVASGAQRIYESDAYLHEVFADHHPKVVLLDGYAVIREGYVDAAVFHTFAHFLPIFFHHNNWKHFDWDMITAPVRYTNRQPGKGYRGSDQVVPVDLTGFMAPTDEKAPFPLTNRLYLRHVAKLCRENGAELALVTIPSPYNWTMADHNALAADAAALGLPFYDLNLCLDELGLDAQTDFQDEGDHLNNAGARKVSDWLGELLSQHYHLPDHRGDGSFYRWRRELEASKA